MERVIDINSRNARAKKEIEKHSFFKKMEKTFVSFLKYDMGFREDTAEDIFIESYNEMYNNVCNGDFEGSEKSLASYLRGICWRQATHELRHDKLSDSADFPDPDRAWEAIQSNRDLKDIERYTTKATISWDEIERIKSLIDDDDDYYKDENIDEILGLANLDKDPIHELMDKFEDLVKNLPEPCNTLLWGKYWDDFSHVDLARLLDYTSASTSKVQTSRCLDKFYKAIEPEVKRLSLNLKRKKRN